MSRVVLLATTAALAVAAAGCAQLPSERPTGGELAATFQDIAQAPGPQADLATWWTGFSDPTLDALATETLDRNADIRVAAERIIAARAQGRSTVARFAPDLDIGAQTQTTSVLDGPGTFGAGGAPIASGDTVTTGSIGPQVSWELPLFGRLGAAIEGDRANQAAAAADAQAVRVAVVGDLVATYTDLRAAQTRLATLDGSIARFQRVFEIASVARRAGLSSDIELADAERLLAGARARRAPVVAAEGSARDRLQILRDRAPGTTDPLGQALAAPGPVPTFARPLPAATPAVLLRLRPDVRAAEQRALLAAAGVGVARSELWPRLTLGGSIKLGDTLAGAASGGATTVASVVPNLVIPLWDFGQRRAAVTQRESEFRQALIGYRATVLSAAGEAQGALRRRARGGEALADARRSEEAARRRADAVGRLQEAGLSSLRERLLAETELLEASLVRLDAEAADTAAVIAVFRAFGGGA